MFLNDPSNFFLCLQKNDLLFKILPSYPLPDLKVGTGLAEVKIDLQVFAKLDKVFFMETFSLGVFGLSNLTVSGIFSYFSNYLLFNRL
jgi:hypothetical protein